MTVSNSQLANATTFNNAFVSRTASDNTTGKKDLENAAAESGPNVENVQREVNSLNSFSGRASGSAFDALPTWANNDVGVSTNNLYQRAEALTAEFNPTSGHSHTGAGGEGPQIAANTLTGLNYFRAEWQEFQVTGAVGIDDDVSSSFVSKTPGGTSGFAGVITTPPNNKVYLIKTSDGTNIEDAEGQRVFGRLTESGGVWTLTYFTNEAGVETSYSMTSTNITVYFREVFTLGTLPTIGSDTGAIGSLDYTADIVDASAIQRGVVSIGTQTFAGNKTFTGTIGASNLSGTNTGDLTLAPVGATPNANGGSITGQVLNLEPASASFGGVVSTLAQTFAGDKTFQDFIEAQSELFGAIETDSTSTGVAQTLATPLKTILKLTDAGLASIESITAPSKAQLVILVNAKASDLDVIDGAGNILTGTGADLTMTEGASIWLAYDTVATKWRVVGGSGGGGSGSGTGTIFTATAGENLALGDAVYISIGAGDGGRTSGRAYKVDATNDNRVEFVGIVTATATTGNPVLIQNAGELLALTGLTLGLPVFASVTTPGAFQNAAPTANGQWIIQVGIATSATSLAINGAGSAAISKISSSGSGAFIVQSTKTANYTATAADDALLCDATSASMTITLPAVSAFAGKIYHIKKIDSSINTVTIDGNGSETIDGALTQVIGTQYQSISLVCNGTNWSII